MIDYDPQTGCDDAYDDCLQWVIQEVIDAINNRQCTDQVWFDVFEMIKQQDVETAYKEYLEELKT